MTYTGSRLFLNYTIKTYLLEQLSSKKLGLKFSVTYVTIHDLVTLICLLWNFCKVKYFQFLHLRTRHSNRTNELKTASLEMDLNF